MSGLPAASLRDASQEVGWSPLIERTLNSCLRNNSSVYAHKGKSRTEISVVVLAALSLRALLLIAAMKKTRRAVASKPCSLHNFASQLASFQSL